MQWNLELNFPSLSILLFFFFSIFSFFRFLYLHPMTGLGGFEHLQCLRAQ